MDENKNMLELPEATKKYGGILHAMGRVGEMGVHTELAYLASQVEMAEIPHEAKRPFYAVIEALCRNQAKVEQNEGLAKLADFYSKKIEAEKA